MLSCKLLSFPTLYQAKKTFSQVKPLLYGLNPVLQVLNCLMLKDILDNILTGKLFIPLNHSQFT